MLGINVEDVLVRLDRFGHVPQRHFQDLSQPKSELDDLIVGVRQTNLATNNVRLTEEAEVAIDAHRR